MLAYFDISWYNLKYELHTTVIIIAKIVTIQIILAYLSYQTGIETDIGTDVLFLSNILFNKIISNRLKHTPANPKLLTIKALFQAPAL